MQRINKAERIGWIDTAKGIGVFLVVLGHMLSSDISHFFESAIYSFHMPMFFMVSGFVFSIKSGESFIGFVLKKCKRLLVPTFFFMVLGTVVYIDEYNPTRKLVINRFFFWEGRCPFNDPCWYFIVLFEVYIAAFLLRKIYNRGPATRIAAAVIFFVAGYIVYSNKVFLPFGLDYALPAFGFFAAGQLFRDVYPLLKENKRLAAAVIAVCLTGWIVMGCINDKVAFYRLRLNHYWLFVGAGICGSLVYFALCDVLCRIKPEGVARSWAANSIFIVGTHYLFYLHYVKIYERIIMPSWAYSLLAVVVTLLIMMLYQPICAVVDRYVPWLNGKSLPAKPAAAGEKDVG